MATTPSTTDQRDPKVVEYQKEYGRWLPVLESYHTQRFDKNYRQYTAYASTEGTHARISDPVAPEQVERVIQRLFEREPTFMVSARGRNLPGEITEIMQSVVSYFWTNPERTQQSGTMRSKLKVLGREFCVTGNCCVETYYDPESKCPDFRVIPIEDVIFNPTKTLKTSGVYYVRQFVSLQYLEDMAERTDKDGKVLGGVFNAGAVARLKEKYREPAPTVRSDPTSNRVMRSGTSALDVRVEEILLVTRYEGSKTCRVADWEVVVQEFDNRVLEDDPLDFAMDIEVPKQPYGFSLLDFINGLTAAKDLILNQVIDYGSKALNPPLFVDPSLPPVSQKTLRNAYRLGGIVMARKDQASHQDMSPLPPVGFELLNYIQQRSEGVSGIGAYLAGVPNQANDKTQGTAAGTKALLAQAVSPVRDRQINLEESIIEPIVNKMLRMAGRLMGSQEERFVFVTGQSPRWIKATRGLLSGKITLADLVMADLVSMAPPIDPATGQPKVDPATGQPMPSPAAELSALIIQGGGDPASHVLFEADWVARVETGSMADTDSEQDVQNFKDYVQFRAQFRIPTDIKKVSEEMARRMGIKMPEQYDMPQGAGASGSSGLPMVLPKETIAFDDLPPAGKIQMAGNAGIQLSPQDVAATPPPGSPPPPAMAPGR